MRLHVAKWWPNNMPHVHVFTKKKTCLFLFLWAWSVLFQVVWILFFLKRMTSKWYKKYKITTWRVKNQIEGQSHFHFYKPLPPKKLESMCAMFDATIIATFPRGTVDKLPAQQPKFKGFFWRLCHQPLPSIWIHKVLGPNDLGIQGSKESHP